MKIYSTRYNIIFLGIYGAMKNQLINYLFNRKILNPLTECQSFYISGNYNGRAVNVAAMIDLCGPSINSTQLQKMIKDSLTEHFSQIDAVVIVTAGRLEMGHKTSITHLLEYLQFRQNPEKFVFIYNESPLASEEFRKRNLDYVLSELGVSSSNKNKVREGFR